MLRMRGRLTTRFGDAYHSLAFPPAADVEDLAIDGASETEVYTGVCAMDEMNECSDAIAVLAVAQTLH